MRVRKRFVAVIVLVVLGSLAWTALAASPGTISTFAGDGTYGSTGDAAAASSAELQFPTGLAIDSEGDVFIADVTDDTVRMVAAASCTATVQSPCPFGLPKTVAGDIYTIAGQHGQSGSPQTPELATDAKLDQPQGVVVDSAGDVLIVDSADRWVQLVARSACTTSCPFGQDNTTAGWIYRIAGEIGNGAPGNGGAATSAFLDYPTWAAFDARGDLLIDEYYDSEVRLIAASACTTSCPFGLQDLTAGDIYQLAGNGTSAYAGDGASAADAELNEPEGIATDPAGDLLIADTANNAVRLVAATTCSSAATCPYGLSSMTVGDIYTLVGSDAGGGGYMGGGGDTGDDGPASSATVLNPEALTVDARGDLLISDAGNNVVRLVAWSSCASSCPFGLSSMTEGDIYTVAGGGTNFSPTYDGAATGAEFNDPQGLAINASGDLFIADQGNYLVREVTGGPPDASPATTTIKASPASVVADGVSKSTITVQTKDADGTDFTTGGDVVTISSTLGTLSSVTDHGDGTYTATLTSSTLGTADVSASVNGNAITSGDASVKFTAVPVAPVVSHFAQSHSKWAEKKSKAKHAPPVGTTFSFTLSEKATVTLTFSRVEHGKDTAVGSLTVKGASGKNSVKFSGVLKGKHLAAGTYKVTLTATADAKTSKSSSLTFKIVS